MKEGQSDSWEEGGSETKGLVLGTLLNQRREHPKFKIHFVQKKFVRFFKIFAWDGGGGLRLSCGEWKQGKFQR